MSGAVPLFPPYAFMAGKGMSSFTDRAIPVPEVKNEWSCTSVPPICFHGGKRHDLSFLLIKII
jgi:hypothetical protein